MTKLAIATTKYKKKFSKEKTYYTVDADKGRDEWSKMQGDDLIKKI